MSFFSQGETHLKGKVSKLYLSWLEKKYGLPLKVRKQQKDVYSKVYGIEAGEISEDFEEIYGMLVTDSFEASDSISTGMFDEGWLYTTKHDLINVGDIIEVVRPDNLNYKYKVIRRETVGLTQEVMPKFRLSSYHE